MNTVQISRQRELLQAIASDIADAEQIAFGSSMDMESKQQLLGEKFSQIRQTAMAGINDRNATAMILGGYKADCLESLLGFLDLSNSTVDEIADGLLKEPSDTQLQLLAMSATSYAERVSKYLQLKADVIQQEVNNG